MNIFGNWFKRKEWKTIKVIRGRWTIFPTTTFDDFKYSGGDDYCLYEIKVCEATNEIKIDMSGYKPKYHRLYESIVKINNDLQLISKKYQSNDDI